MGSRSEAPSTITVVHGRSKHIIELRETLGQLREDISTVTDFSPDEFTIIIGGRKIKDPDDTTITSTGIVHGKTAMISVSRAAVKPKAGRHVATDTTPLGKVRKSDGELDKFEEALKAVEQKIRKHTMGFLDYEKTLEALERDLMDTKGVEEGCMQVIEKLDSVSIAGAGASRSDHSSEVCRAERKAAVMKGQRILKQCDIVRDKIGEFRKDEFDEVKSRRGKG